MKTIVITGGSQGIGLATAQAFAQMPDTTICLIARNAEKLSAAKATFTDPARVDTYCCDLTDSKATAQTCQQLLEAHQTIDVLINNAGAFEPGDLFSTDLAQFNRQLDVNLQSAFQVSQMLAENMVKNKSGYIFYISSVAALGPYPRGLAYSVAKHAMMGLAHGVRDELKTHGVRVSCVYPGATLTPTWGDISAMGLQEERLMRAEDVADAIVSAYQLSSNTVVEDIILRPQLGDL